MRMFRIGAGYAPEEIFLEEKAGKRPVKEIKIGEEGRGRKQVIIPVSGSGDEVGIKEVGSGFLIVRKEEVGSSGRCLATIDACGSYQQGRTYDIAFPEGGEEKVRILAEGYSAFGDAGRVGGGPEYLAIVEPGAKFALATKYSRYFYAWDGENWLIEARAEHDARLTREAVAAGEGEWL